MVFGREVCLLRSYLECGVEKEVSKGKNGKVEMGYIKNIGGRSTN